MRLRIVKTADGRLIVTELHAGEQRGDELPQGPFEITSRHLRNLPLATILTDAAHQISPVRPVTQIDELPPQRRRKARLDREFLEKVAALYRESMEYEPTKPYQYFTHRAIGSTDVRTSSTSTARRWVWQARKVGLLGPAVKGKAGELPASDKKGATDGEQAIRQPQGDEGRNTKAADGR